MTIVHARGSGRALVVAIVFGVAVLTAPGASAQVQGIINIDIKDTPIAEVLKQLQQQVPGLQYGLDPAVRGNVTVSLRDIDINAALRLIVDSVNATYRIDQGTYVIEPKPAVAPPRVAPVGPGGLRAPVRTPPAAPTGPAGGVSAAPTVDEEGEEELVVRRIKVKRADPVDVAIVFGGTVVSSRMGQMAGFGGGGWGGGGWGGGGWGGGGWGGRGGFGGGGWGGRGGFGGGGWGGRGGFGGGWGGRGGFGGGGWGGRGGFGGGWGGRGGW